MSQVFFEWAKKYGWSYLCYQENIRMVSFIKAIYNRKARINIYLTHKGRETGRYTVATSMTHPKRGKTQLYRRGCSLQTVEHLFKNPRTHTRRGYYEK